MTGIIIAASAAALIIFLPLLYVFVLVRPRRCDIPTSLLRDYAHRGLHGDGVPENSLAAFRRAVEEGYGIELDVQLSRDGEVAVFHDYVLSRMTERGEKLCELDMYELSSLSLAGTVETIPTLSQVLELVDGRVPLLVELKGESLDTRLCRRVAPILAEYKGEYLVESFNPFLIRGIRRLLPEGICGQLYTNVCRDKKRYNIVNVLLSMMAFNFIARPDFIAYNKRCRDSVPVRLACSHHGAARFVWTVTDADKASMRADEHSIFEEARGVAPRRGD